MVIEFSTRRARLHASGDGERDSVAGRPVRCHPPRNKRLRTEKADCLARVQSGAAILQRRLAMATESVFPRIPHYQDDSSIAVIGIPGAVRSSFPSQ